MIGRLGVATMLAAGAGLAAGAAPAAAEAAGCSVNSTASSTHTSGLGVGCVWVEARLDRYYQGKMWTLVGKRATYSTVSSSLGEFRGNYVRANNGGVVTAWISVPWSSKALAVDVKAADE